MRLVALDEWATPISTGDFTKSFLGCSVTTWTCGCKEFHGENCNGRATELASPADVAMKVRVHRLR
jgi:hypothetical protein